MDEATEASETTLVMVDDNIDEIFLTRRKVRKEGIVNRFVSERQPERLFDALQDLIDMGVDKRSFFILLDVNMPRVSGFDILKRIREHPDYQDVPVVMFSASDDEADIMESLEMGSDGYLVKPFTADEFFAALANIPRIKKRLIQ